MKKVFLNGQALLNHMEWHVKRTVKHYQTDFYKYDIERIHDIENNAQYGEYLWIIRECGTHIVTLTSGEKLSDNVYFQAILENYGTRITVFTFNYKRNGQFEFVKGLYA